jgi:hypothetical protein
MQMIAEDGIGQAIDTEDGSEKLQSKPNPLTSMFVTDPGIGIIPTEKRAPNTAMHTMKDLDLLGIHDLAPTLSSHEFAPLKE